MINSDVLELSPELGIELTPDITYMDLRSRAEAACNSALLLAQHGLDVDPVPSDREAAAALTAAYANDPEKTSRAMTPAKLAQMTPASLVAVREYLDEYGRAVVQQAVEVRHLVTNRLLEESRNPDPRIRIRALELLGKHCDVGLFSDRSEVTITHQTTDELRERLRDKLQKLVRAKPFSPNTIEISGEIVDVDEELGLKDHDAPVITVQTPEFDDE
jgi:hypothetical protein